MPKTVLKYIITGDSDVGKSSLMLQYVRRCFNPSMKMTIAVRLRGCMHACGCTHRIRHVNMYTSLYGPSIDRSFCILIDRLVSL